ncbi:hypothetical protein ElyMa_006461000, partial [Elysia marginata]
NEIKTELRPGVLGNLLMSLPDGTPAKKVTEWLCADVIPVACSIDPQAVVSTV